MFSLADGDLAHAEVVGPNIGDSPVTSNTSTVAIVHWISAILTTQNTTFSFEQTITNKSISTDLQIAVMGYEDSVYLAKLAEQAERYEGMQIYSLWSERMNTNGRNRDGREHEVRRFWRPRTLRRGA